MVIAKPEFGEQACGDIGEGRLAEPTSIAAQTANIFQNTQLSDKNVMITLGGTIEAIDPVRFISNHSSGKMGMALASACIEAGATVTLVIGSISVAVESRAKSVFVTSAQDMHEAVMNNIDEQDIFISCAAVADYRPANIAKNKIKKTRETLSIDLVRNPDILASVCQMKDKPVCIGFAAETENLLENGKNKLKNKGCDAIILNDVSNSKIGLKSDQNEVFFITKNDCEKIDINSKIIIAQKLIIKISEV
jgi:phosphopantothenoylcysteine decarboxylase/phosphopantothenate--cysteine ligase